MESSIINDIIVFSGCDFNMPIQIWTDDSKTIAENISGNTYDGYIKARFSDVTKLVLFTPTITNSVTGELLVFIPLTDIALLSSIGCSEDSDRYTDVGIYRITQTRNGVKTPFLEGKVTLDKA